MSLVCGIGVSEKGDYNRYIDGKHTLEYIKWREMLRRCYSEVYQQKKPTYQLCSVQGSFLNFQLFAKWCNNQTGFRSDWQLDKDLLVKGNKVYSSDYCVFLPGELNSILLKSGSIRGKLPIGVTQNKSCKSFVASCKQNNKRVYLGSYKTSDEAFAAYKQFKECYIKELALKYKCSIDYRAYIALMEYEVKIED